MNQIAKGCILLRGASDHGKGPDGIPAMIHPVYFEEWKRVDQAVVTQVITEGSFGLGSTGLHGSRDDKIRIRRYHVPPVSGISKPPSGKPARENELTQSFGQGHHCAKGVGGRPTDKNADLERFAALQCVGVVDASIEGSPLCSVVA